MPSDHSTVACAIVTYNRLEDLKRCLASVFSQTRPFDQVVVFNGASTDGTGDYLASLAKKEKRLEVVNHSQNIGGAGGFSFLIERLREKVGAMYIIDDDVVLEEGALAALTGSPAYRSQGWGYLGSLVLDMESHKVAPMNLPALSRSGMQEPWQVAHPPITTCSFVGMLLSSQAAKEAGLPVAEFFIYGDDYEYSLRIGKRFPCYLVPESVVLHKGKSVAFEETPPGGLWKHWYASRNLMWVYARHRSLVLYFGDRFVIMLRAIRKHGLGSWPYLRTVIGGMAAGLFFHPKVRP